MVLLVLILLSLSVVYFARLFAQKSMRAAALTVIVFYCCLLAWGVLLFGVNAGGLGFNQTYSSLDIIGEDVPAHALPALTAIIIVVSLTIVSSVVAVFHGLFEITRAVISVFKSNKKLTHANGPCRELQNTFNPIFSTNILLLNCRLNC